MHVHASTCHSTTKGPECISKWYTCAMLTYNLPCLDSYLYWGRLYPSSICQYKHYRSLLQQWIATLSHTYITILTPFMALGCTWRSVTSYISIPYRVYWKCNSLSQPFRLTPRTGAWYMLARVTNPLWDLKVWRILMHLWDTIQFFCTANPREGGIL